MAWIAARSSSAVALAAALVLMLLVGALWALVFVDFRQAGGGSAAGMPAATTPSSASSSSSPTRAEGEWSMGDARKALARDGSRTLVLGDSTGDGYDEWVYLWAQSDDLPVASWQTESESGYDGESEETRVWSGAMSEATADYPAEHREIWPEEDPHLVLLSYGHFHESPGEATEALEELRADSAERAPKAPIVVVLQSPQGDDANAETREAIADWAKESRLPTIDVAAAYEDSGQAPEDLRLDDINPSQAGSQLWADTVAEELG